jgi:hypothetical protein
MNSKIIPPILIFAVIAVGVTGIIYYNYEGKLESQLNKGKMYFETPEWKQSIQEALQKDQLERNQQAATGYEAATSTIITDESIKDLPSVQYIFQDKILKIVQSSVLFRSRQESSYRELTNVIYGTPGGNNLAEILPTSLPEIVAIKNFLCDMGCSHQLTFVNLNTSKWVQIDFGANTLWIKNSEGLDRWLDFLVMDNCGKGSGRKVGQVAAEITGIINHTEGLINLAEQDYKFVEAKKLTCNPGPPELGDPPPYKEAYKMSLESLDAELLGLNMVYSGVDAYGKNWNEKVTFSLRDGEVVNYTSLPAINVLTDTIKEFKY